MSASTITTPDAAQKAVGDAGDLRFRVDGMDCASCAATVQKVVESLEGVRTARVSFGNAMLLVDGEVGADAVQTAVRRAGYTANPAGVRAPDSTVPFWRRGVRSLSTTASVGLLLIAVIAALAGAPRAVAEPLYLASMAVGGWPIALAAWTALRRRQLDMNVLMTMAAIGAVAIGAYSEAAWVLVLFAVGTTLESFALDRSRRSVEALMELAPERANVLVDDHMVPVAVEDVEVGSQMLVRAGERVPLDGVVVAGNSSVDESALTGESVPVDKEPGSPVFAGTLNAFGAMTVEVTAVSSASTLARVAQLVADAQGSQAPSERFVDRFARYYTPFVFAAALLVTVVPTMAGGDIDTWLYRGLALLIVACPCALVVSVPVSVVSAIGGAARRGVLIKGGQVLEDLGRVRAVALDKTGTLTNGTPRLASVTPLGVDDADAVLGMAAAVERGSEHPLGQAIVRAAQERGLSVTGVTDFEALPGRGATAVVAGRSLWIGGPRMARDRNALLPPAMEQAEERGETSILLGQGTDILAVFGLADQARARAAEVVGLLRDRAGVQHVTMLTGDNERVARAVAGETGVTDWRAALLPEDKLDAIRELQEVHGAVAMVGDGVNDAPALAAADVGVAMGAAGSGIALETADVALMGDDLERLPEAITLSRKALRIMRQNVAISLATKAVFVALAPLGYVTLVVAVAADMGVSLVVTLNGLRLLGRSSPVAPAARATARELPEEERSCSDGCGSVEPEAEPALESECTDGCCASAADQAAQPAHG